MQVDKNVQSYLEINVDSDKKELIKGLTAIFDYSNELALRIYKTWRQAYKLDNYKTIENEFTQEEITTLKKLDEMYREEVKKVGWW